MTTGSPASASFTQSEKWAFTSATETLLGTGTSFSKSGQKDHTVLFWLGQAARHRTAPTRATINPAMTDLSLTAAPPQAEPPRSRPSLFARVPPDGTRDADKILDLFVDWAAEAGFELYPAQEE